MPYSPSARLSRPGRLLACAVLAAALAPARVLALEGDFTLGGSLAVTSEYIYRGVSESDGNAAAQADVHAEKQGSFGGVWSSTRDRDLEPGGSYELELYAGHRFNLGGAWDVTLSARSHYFAGGVTEQSADYQMITGTLTWLDRWTLSLTAVPNAVRYWFYRRVPRSPAWIAETTGQWLIVRGLFVTGGAGYYYASGTGPGIERATGYAYGDAGLAYVWRRWRVDVGYFVAQRSAARTSPYPVAHDRFAGTLAWRF